MSEPTRLRDDGAPEAGTVRALLRAGEPTRAISHQERRRTAARVARLTSVAAVGALAWLPAAALGAGLGVAAVSVAWLVPPWLSPPSAPPRPSRSTAPVEPPAPVDLSPSPAVAPAPSAPPAAPAPPADPLAQEAALLERARTALAASPAQALALTEAYAARFPGGMLRIERDLVAIDALRRLGRLDEARARGEAVLARAPGSLYEARIRKLLDGTR
jgi:hypothetical protein